MTQSQSEDSVLSRTDGYRVTGALRSMREALSDAERSVGESMFNDFGPVERRYDLRPHEKRLLSLLMNGLTCGPRLRT